MVAQIHLKEFKITDIGEFVNQLLREVKPNYLSPPVCELLKIHLSPKIVCATLEEPYVDYDFRDTYYTDYSKRFLEFSRNSKRIHLFDEKEEYLGFFTLHSIPPRNLGRSYLSPKALKNTSSGFYCLATYRVNLCGEEHEIDAFPWMQQDINVARCAHVALWEIIRYFSQRQPCYKEVTMGELIHMADSSMRRVPSNGMTIDQMAQVLSKVGFSVELWNRKAIEKVLERAVDNIKIHELVYTYIESGLPVIAVYRSKPHAICIMGHGGMLPKSEFRDKKGIISSSLLHRNFITCDDNKMPYSIQGSKDLEDIDFLISSLHSKMYVRVYDFLNNFLSEFEQKMVTSRLEANTQYIRRVLITSGKSLKKFILQHSDDEKYRDYMGRLQMPKFVIMVEYGALDSYPESINFRAVFDSTALQSLDADAILIAFKAKKALLVPGIKDPIPLNAEEEPLYKNNLKEVVL